MNFYEGHTTFCLDLGHPEMPITCSGMRFADVHVTDLDEAFGLTPYARLEGDMNDEAAAQVINMANSDFGATWEIPVESTKTAIYKFNAGGGMAPIRVITPDLTLGSRHEKKKMRYMELHGYGVGRVRVKVDGREVVSHGTSILSENPSKSRKIAFPRGTTGYSLSFEITGTLYPRMIEVTYDPMTSPL